MDNKTNWDIQYLHSDKPHALVEEIQSLCGVSGWELVSVFHDGSQYHAFLKKPKK